MRSSAQAKLPANIFNSAEFQSPQKANVGSDLINVVVPASSREPGRLASIKERQKGNLDNRSVEKMSGIMTNNSSVATKCTTSPFIKRLQKQTMATVPMKDMMMRVEMMGSRTFYGKPMNQNSSSKIFPPSKTDRRSMNGEAPPASSFLSSMRPSTAVTSSFRTANKHSQKLLQNHTQPRHFSALTKSESAPQLSQASTQDIQAFKSARKAFSKFTVAIGPRLHSAGRAARRPFVSNEDLTMIDLKKKLAKIARLKNNKDTKPPVLQTAERALQRAHSYKNIRQSNEHLSQDQKGKDPQVEAQAEQIVHLTSFKKYFSQTRALEPSYIPSIIYCSNQKQVTRTVSADVFGSKLNQTSGGSDDKSDHTDNTFVRMVKAQHASVERLHSTEKVPGSFSIRDCSCINGRRRHTKGKKRLSLSQTSRVKEVVMRLSQSQVWE